MYFVMYLEQASVAEVVPLKQGLKQWGGAIMAAKDKIVAEVVPLKQGLKPGGEGGESPFIMYVAEVVPLKQGLKPPYAGYNSNPCVCCRGSSIKTRIETQPT